MAISAAAIQRTGQAGAANLDLHTQSNVSLCCDGQMDGEEIPRDLSQRETGQGVKRTKLSFLF